MRGVRAVGVTIALAVVLLQVAVLVLRDAGSECGDRCTSGQRAADAVLVLVFVEVGVAALVAVPLGLALLVREGVRESRRDRE